MTQMQEMAKAMNPALESFTPKFPDGFAENFANMWPTMSKDMMEATFGNKANPNGLDAKTRLLLTLAGLTMQGAQNEVAMRQTLKHLVAAEARKQEIVDTIGQMSMFAGIPAMTRAMDLAQEVVADKEDKD